jgi:hypothetical protein
MILNDQMDEDFQAENDNSGVKTLEVKTHYQAQGEFLSYVFFIYFYCFYSNY